MINLKIYVYMYYIHTLFTLSKILCSYKFKSIFNTKLIFHTFTLSFDKVKNLKQLKLFLCSILIKMVLISLFNYIFCNFMLNNDCL